MIRPVTLLTLLCAVAVTGSAGQFTCDSLDRASHCTCSPLSLTMYELHCLDVLVSISLQELVQLQCMNINQSRQIDTLSGLHIGDVKRFALRLCPLPDSSIRELMATVGINNVEMLQIQTYSNLNDTLRKKHFEKLFGVRNLSLNNNGLTKLPIDLFEDMGNLTWLDMKFNQIDLPREIFTFTPKLEVLELGNNNMSHLRAGVFKNLEHLRLLNLWSNRLENLTRSVFSDVPNLESLDLNSNQMESIRPDVFADLSKLKKLNLYANAFISLPQGLLARNTELEEFQMQDNKRSSVTLPPGFLSNLPKLKTVKLSGSKVISLPEDTFWNSNNINTIYLNRNQLATLLEQTFRDLESLEHLDLSENLITHLPEGLFYNTKVLKTLKLYYNQITEIPMKLFVQQKNLEFLDLRFNRIKEVKGNQFYNLEKLKALNISDNQLTTLAPDKQLAEFGNYSVLENCQNLEDLQLANNSLIELYGDWRLVLRKLRIVNLSFNHFESLVVTDIDLFSDVFIDLSNNRISRINFHDAELLAASINNYESPYIRDHSTRNKHIKLDNNPFICDCLLLPFVQFVRGDLSPEVQFLFNIQATDLKCHEPKNLEDINLMYLPYRLLTCNLRDSKVYKCPENCSCEYRPIDKGNIINCQGAGLQVLPDYLPLIPRTNHTELNFEGNHLQSVQVPLDKGYENVTHYRLSNNSISDISVAGFSSLIELLDLSHNKMTKLSPETITFMGNAPRLDSIALEDNPWQCDCEAKPLIWLVRRKQVKNKANVTCKDTQMSLEVVDEAEICAETIHFFVITCVVFAIFGLLMALLTVLYYKYQEAIHIYCFSSKWKVLRWLVSRPDVDEEKKYDAFISYAHPDESFVTQHLVPFLEEKGETKFKLCVHYRDFVPGESIQIQILKSIKESRRTIVVLSPSYLQSDWGKMEFVTAYDEALKDGTARVIVILYQDVGPIDELDEQIKIHLQMNTYVKWDSPWFEQQLIYAMPHPPEEAKNIKCIFGCLPRLSVNNEPLESVQSAKEKDEVHNMNKLNDKLSDTKESPKIFINPPTLIIESESKTKTLPSENNQNEATATGV